MGMGWQEVKRSIISKEKCPYCDEGYVITYEITEESDFSMDDKVSTEVEPCSVCHKK